MTPRDMDVEARLDDPPPVDQAPTKHVRNRSGISAGDVDGPGLIGWVFRRGPGAWVAFWTTVGVLGVLAFFLVGYFRGFPW